MTQVKVMFSEYVSVGDAEQVGSHLLVCQSAHVPTVMHLLTQVRVVGSPYRFGGFVLTPGHVGTHNLVPV